MAEIAEITGAAYTGRVYAVQVRAAVDGTVVADADFTAHLAGTASFTDDAGLVWTVEGGGEIGPYSVPWVDVSTRLTHAEWSYGRDLELEVFGPGEATLTLSNDDRHFDPEHAAGPWFGKLQPRTPFRLRLPSDASVLELAADTTNGGHAATADADGLDLTDDLDVRLEATRDWELVRAEGEVLAARWLTLAGGRSWLLALLPGGRVRLRWSDDGTFDVTLVAESTAAIPPAAAERGRLAVRVTLDVDDDLGQHVTRFHTAPSIAGPWTQLGAAVAGEGTTQIHNGTADLTIGAGHDGFHSFVGLVTFTGLVHAFELRDGIGGTALADPDFTAQDPGATSFTDDAGNTWTVSAAGGAAALIADTEPSDVFYGFVEGGFEQHFSAPAKGDAKVDLVDLKGVLHGTPLPAHDYEAEVLADDPVAYWPMDEAEGTRMGDRSGNDRNGAYDGGVVGDEVDLIVGSERSFFAPQSGGNRGRYQGESLPFAPPMTVEAWLSCTRDLTTTKIILAAQEGFSVGVSWALAVGVQSIPEFATPDGELLLIFANNETSEFGDFTFSARGHTRIDDGRVHHAVATVSADGDVALYVDGVAQDLTVLLDGEVQPWPGGQLWTMGDGSNPAGDFGIGGNIGHVAVYDKVLSATRAAAHHAAGVTAFADESTGARLRRVLRAGQVPERLWDVPDGDTTVGAAVYDNASIGEHADKVAESEQGTVFVDHRRGGRVAFRGRFSRHQDPRSAASQYTVTDADTSDAVHYERDGLTVTPNGIDSVVNVCEVRWRGGTEIARDGDSVDAYGAQSRTIETDSPSAQVARSSGQWVVHRHAEPRAQVKSFKLKPGADDRALAAALGLRLSDRVSLTRHPLAHGEAVTGGLFVEGVAHEVEGRHWDTTVRTSSADGIGEIWVWEEGDLWGTTTIWG